MNVIHPLTKNLHLAQTPRIAGNRDCRQLAFTHKGDRHANSDCRG